jgi:hypothetical protein
MLRIIFVAIVVLFSMPAKAQLADVITGCGTITVDSGTRRNMTIDTTASHCISLSSQYPSGSTAITGNSTGTTGAVVGTLSGASAKTARDEQGRFVAKTEEPEPKAGSDAGQACRAKEEAKSRHGDCEARAGKRDQLRARTIAAVLALQPKPEPAAKPDMFEKPDEFVRMNVQEIWPAAKAVLKLHRVDVTARCDQGARQERVTEAFKALDQAAKAGDPQALAVVQAVKQSMDPFGDIVAGTAAQRPAETLKRFSSAGWKRR